MDKTKGMTSRRNWRGRKNGQNKGNDKPKKDESHYTIKQVIQPNVCTNER